MARSSSLVLLVSAAIAAAGIPITGAIADAIDITNPSFESPTVAAGYNSSLPTGWYNLNDAGTYGNLGGSPPVGGPVPPDGTQAAYVETTYGVAGSVASIFQRLGAAPVANAEYTLSVDVGRYGQQENYTNVQNLRGFGFQIGYTTATGPTLDAFASATWFATYTGNGGASDGSGGGVENGTFKSFSVSGDAPGTIPAGDVLIIDFFAEAGTSGNADADGSLALFDDVKLTSNVPEPSTWAMMVLGFAGLAFAGYRRTRRGAAVTG
jgi:hypothetical protein